MLSLKIDPSIPIGEQQPTPSQPVSPVALVGVTGLKQSGETVLALGAPPTFDKFLSEKSGATPEEWRTVVLAHARGAGQPAPQANRQNPVPTVARDPGSLIGADLPNAFVNAVRQVVSHPPPNTSNTAALELRTKYPDTLNNLIRQGPGSTVFGKANGDRLFPNNFELTPAPEAALHDPRDPTAHQYGVLTYLGPVDRSRGITKEFVVKELLEGRYGYPGKDLKPVKANFNGPSDVYAVSPLAALWDPKNLADPSKYDYRIGAIEQMRVPDGVLNMTTVDHNVYPGTIRRTVVEVDGQLFLYTNGVGVNRFNNSGTSTTSGTGNSTIDIAVPNAAKVATAGKLARSVAQGQFASGNDQYGPEAFKALDRRLFLDLQAIRAQRK
jgi:hypothetical protein